MKHSDSKTSLAELNPDDTPCFICLEIENELSEPLVDGALLRTCGCKFKVHPLCWNEWMKEKTCYDCPICRKESQFSERAPTPLLEYIASLPPQPQPQVSMRFICIFASLFILAIVLVTLFLVYSK